MLGSPMTSRCARASAKPASESFAAVPARIAAATAAIIIGCSGSAPAYARPPPIETPGRCSIASFDKFANTRAKFSLEVAGGGAIEAEVDVRKVLSGVLMNDANCENCKIIGAEISRADLRSANLRNADLSDSNLYGTMLNGADLRGAQFENTILTMASFGKDAKGNWAQLEGAHFEGALLSSSDVERLCENPNIDLEVRKYELGCRSSKQ
eukprot:gene25959-11643_t